MLVEKVHSGRPSMSSGKKSSTTTLRSAPFLSEACARAPCVSSNDRNACNALVPEEAEGVFARGVVDGQALLVLGMHRGTKDVLAEPDDGDKFPSTSLTHARTRTTYLSLWLAPVARVARNAQSPRMLLCVTAYGLNPSPVRAVVRTGKGSAQLRSTRWGRRSTDEHLGLGDERRESHPRRKLVRLLLIVRVSCRWSCRWSCACRVVSVVQCACRVRVVGRVVC